MTDSLEAVNLVKAPSSMSEVELEELTNKIIAALKTVYDPEIPADV
jgi:metal-sulfur cluster biosynthetic enzyme